MSIGGVGNICVGCGIIVPSTRKWCSETCRKRALYSDPCPQCGRPMSGAAGRGPNKPKLCRACNSVEVRAMLKERDRPRMEAKIARVIEMLGEDRTNREIAREFNSTPAAINQFIQTLKRQGHAVPARSHKGGRLRDRNGA